MADWNITNPALASPMFPVATGTTTTKPTTTKSTPLIDLQGRYGIYRGPRYADRELAKAMPHIDQVDVLPNTTIDPLLLGRLEDAGYKWFPATDSGSRFAGSYVLDKAPDKGGTAPNIPNPPVPVVTIPNPPVTSPQNEMTWHQLPKEVLAALMPGPALPDKQFNWRDAQAGGWARGLLSGNLGQDFLRKISADLLIRKMYGDIKGGSYLGPVTDADRMEAAKLADTEAQAKQRDLQPQLDYLKLQEAIRNHNIMNDNSDESRNMRMQLAEYYTAHPSAQYANNPLMQLYANMTPAQVANVAQTGLLPAAGTVKNDVRTNLLNGVNTGK